MSSGTSIATGAVLNTTAYDGMLERACLKLSLPVLSVTDQAVCHSFSVMAISNMLMNEWKSGVGEIGKVLPKYKPMPDEPVASLEMPTLKICEIVDNHLTLSTTTRSKFNMCPIRAPEWRNLLKKFDATWGRTDTPPAGTRGENGQTPPVETASPSQVNTTPATEPSVETASENVNWSEVFPDEPTTKAQFEEKYQPASSFAINNQVTGMLVEGPKLFLMATADVSMDQSEPVVCFGAGTWLLDGKATAFDEVRC